MKSRVTVLGLGVLTLVGLTACGSGSAGTGAAPATTILLGTPSYQTLAPMMTAAPTTTDPSGVVAGEQSHEVVFGEYLYGIAKTYCVKAEDIVQFNGWLDGVDHQLVPGESIKIPPNGCVAGTATQPTNPNPLTVATAVATTTTFDEGTGGTYIVVDGDYLGGIAAKTGTTIDGIVAANGWVDGRDHVIYAGLKIRLPAKTG